MSTADIDYSEFLCDGQGYASFIYKISLWLDKPLGVSFPDIEVQRSGEGVLALKEPSVIPYIAVRVGIEAKTLGQMIQVDLDGMSPSASFLFADEFKTPTSINLPVKPTNFCMTCFVNSLLSKKVPIFNAGMQSPWATHCIFHQHPLFPVTLLEMHSARDPSFGRYNDGSQYRHWCNRVEQARIVLLERFHGRSRNPVGPTSKIVIAINQLFYNEDQAKLGAAILGLSDPPELIRQKLHTVFYLLSRRHQSWSIGRNMTHELTRGGWFPTADSFNARLLDLLTAEQKHRCIEFMAHFIADPEVQHPYLISDEMRSAKLAYINQTNTKNPDTMDKPLVCLAWVLREHFDSSFSSDIERLFPRYATTWSQIYDSVAA